MKMLKSDVIKTNDTVNVLHHAQRCVLFVYENIKYMYVSIQYTDTPLQNVSRAGLRKRSPAFPNNNTVP